MCFYVEPLCFFEPYVMLSSVFRSATISVYTSLESAIYIYIYIYIHTYTHMYIHTCIHTYVYIYTPFVLTQFNIGPLFGSYNKQLRSLSKQIRSLNIGSHNKHVLFCLHTLLDHTLDKHGLFRSCQTSAVRRPRERDWTGK